jgi:hypothetical protein
MYSEKGLGHLRYSFKFGSACTESNNCIHGDNGLLYFRELTSLKWNIILATREIFVWSSLSSFSAIKGSWSDSIISNRLTHILQYRILLYGILYTLASIRYIDVFAKVEGRWLFAERKLIFDWTDTRPINGWLDLWSGTWSMTLTLFNLRDI